MARATVVVADDQATIRDMLKLTLRLDGRFEVVATAEDASAAVSMVAEHRPAVVVLDLGMPGGSGLDVIADLRRSSPATQILVYSAWAAASAAEEALRLGADRYLEKTAGLKELVKALAELCDATPTTPPTPGG